MAERLARRLQRHRAAAHARLPQLAQLPHRLRPPPPSPTLRRPADHLARAGRRARLPAVRRRRTRRRTRQGRPRRRRQSRPLSREHLPEVRREVSARGPRPARVLRRAEARARQHHVVQPRAGRPQRTAGDCARAAEASTERAGSHGSRCDVEYAVTCHEHVASVAHSCHNDCR